MSREEEKVIHLLKFIKNRFPRFFDQLILNEIVDEFPIITGGKVVGFQFGMENPVYQKLLEIFNDFEDMHTSKIKEL